MSVWKTFYDHGTWYIKKMFFGEGITEIYYGLPQEYTEEVSFPSTLRILGSSSFKGADLKKLILPEGLERIEWGAFLWCHELESVILPSTLKYIDSTAFGYTDQTIKNNKDLMEEIFIPKSVEYIGYGAFEQRHGLVITLEAGTDTSGYDKDWNTSGYTADLPVIYE